MDVPSNDVTAGFWRNNLALVRLLALCPLLAVTTTAVNGFALGVGTTAVLLVASFIVSLLRHTLMPGARIPLTLLIVTALVTCVDLLTNALLDDLHETLGIFIPLMITNCGIVVHAEQVAGRRGIGESVGAATTTGLGFLAVLVVLGAARELVGHGTILSGLSMLTGDDGTALGLQLPFRGALVAVLPPGALFGVAALLALRNRLAARAPNAQRAEAADASAARS